MEEDTYTNPNEEAIVRCETTAGTITMQLIRAWSPIGYDRAVELFERKFYDHSHFYRVVPHFLVQFGKYCRNSLWLLLSLLLLFVCLVI